MTDESRFGRRGALAMIFAGVIFMTAGCASNARNIERDIEIGPVRSHGVDGQLVVHGRRVSGELLEVSDTAFVMRTDDAIVLIPKFAVDESNFRDLDVHRGAELAGDVLEQHRLMSRFPMGMPPEALRSLLQQHGQSELEIVTR